MHSAGWKIISLNRTVTGEPWLGEIQCDLTEQAQLDSATEQILAGTDRLDACVLSAAIRRLQPVAALPMADMMASVAVNLIAPFQLTQTTLPLMRSSAGIYVFMGSHAGSRFFEGGAAYCTTKAALKALVEVLLLEERGSGVRAVLVSAGAIANRDGDCSPLKMSVQSVGRFVAGLVTQTPADIAVGEVEIRPARLDPPLVSGIGRLQRV